jgi:hypothetical protein
MKVFAPLALVVAALVSAPSFGQVPHEIITPDRTASRLGLLQFRDGVPAPETADKIYDYLDFSRGVESFLNGLSGVSVAAIHNGLKQAGVNDNDVLLFSKLMDAKSLFLTANCDTVYFVSFIDLSKGPMVVEVPTNTIGTFDDMWFRWIVDVGIPGPDRGQGGAYLILPPNYDGPLPEGGYFIVRSRTNRAMLFGRAFLENNSPDPVAERIKKTYKAYPYVRGGYGTSIASFLEGKTPLGPLHDPPQTKFVEGSGRVMNTVPPNDFSFYELLDELVQNEPASALDPELGGQFAAIGIVKGKAFKPDERMHKILSEAVAVGNAASRTVSIRPPANSGVAYYPNTKSNWSNPLFVGGYGFMDPPAEITKAGVKPFPSTGARTLDARTSFFYLATVITPAMVMRLPNIGSEYLGTFYDSKSKPLDGAKTYKLTLPPNIPAEKFWSLTIYDNQTRSMLDTSQRYPRAGSQSYPSPAAKPDSDGSTTVYFGPKRPDGVNDGNWIETVPGKGWFVLFRLYSPRQSFFDKTWRPGEIETVN